MWICKMCETLNEDHLTRCSACGAAKVEKVWTPQTPPPVTPPPPPVEPLVTPNPPVEPSVTSLPDSSCKVWGHTWFYYLLRWFASISLLLCFISVPDQEYTPLIVFIVLRLLMFFACSIESGSGRLHIPFLDTHNAELVSQAQADATYWFMILCWGVFFALTAALFFADLSYDLENAVINILAYDSIFFAPLSDLLLDKKIYAHLQNTRS